MEHEKEREIILKLIHTPLLSFNELWGKRGESNKFAYHLQKLVDQGLVGKNGGYSLTSEGRKLSAFIEGDTGEKAKFPTFTVCVLVWNDGKILAQKRLKEPYYGAWGFVSGKINFGQNLIDCAKRDLLEETGLIGEDFKISGLEMSKTFEDEKLLFHHYLYCVHCKLKGGVLKKITHKAEHKWVLPEEYRKIRSFPETWPYEDLFYPKGYTHIESERHMKDGVFISGKLLKLERL